jgi:Uncharacterized conserved protein (some members contain a von Willebrand factor type A (vWA) domain)
MLAKETLKKVKKIQLKIARLSNDAMSGHYTSVFKGMGIEFDEVRAYIPGDDVRAIDWNVTARSGIPYIKRYIEERELTIMLLVDLSASQRFGTVNSLKCDLAAEISALLAFLAIQNNDKVGLLIFSDHCERFIPPQKGRHHVLRVIREILDYEPSGIKTNISGALEFVNRILKHRSVIFLLSDFLDCEFERPLKHLSRHHDLIAIDLNDPREFELPSLGLLELEDRESGSRVIIDTSDPVVRSTIKQKAISREEAMAKLFKRNKVDRIEIFSDRSYIEPLQKFFRKRERRIR